MEEVGSLSHKGKSALYFRPNSKWTGVISSLLHEVSEPTKKRDAALKNKAFLFIIIVIMHACLGEDKKHPGVFFWK